MTTNSKVLAGLLGACVGDALGVPVEFCSRNERIKSPITSMQGYGTHNQPAGTWSDDSSLTFCLAESLCQNYDLNLIAKNFCRWYSEAFWTAHGQVFDIGITTATALRRLKRENSTPNQSGNTEETSNGNGSLMRILPLAYYHKTLPFPELINRVHNVSCITHAHPRCQISCGIYISILICLLKGMNPQEAYQQGLEAIRNFYTQPPYISELQHFQRIFSGNIAALPVDEIESGGYVIHSLEASLWCFLNTSSYSEAVLKAVNLGGDTDTTGIVTGGLAGIYYGVESIPTEWVEQLARKEDIFDLASRLETAIYS